MIANSDEAPRENDPARSLTMRCPDCGEVTTGTPQVTMCAPIGMPRGHRMIGVPCDGCGKLAWADVTPRGWRWPRAKRGRYSQVAG